MSDKTRQAKTTPLQLRTRYDNFIGGDWRSPAKQRHFVDKSPIDSSTLCEVASSDADDVERALDAAHVAKAGWGRTAPDERARILNRIADRIEDNLELLARVETRDNGKPIRGNPGHPSTLEKVCAKPLVPQTSPQKQPTNS